MRNRAELPAPADCFPDRHRRAASGFSSGLTPLAANLHVLFDRLRRRLFELKSQAVTEKLENPREMGEIRRDVARIKTEQRSREIAANTEQA